MEWTSGSLSFELFLIAGSTKYWDQVVQDFIQSGLEYFQEWWLHDDFGKLAPVCNHGHNGKFCSYIRISFFNLCCLAMHSCFQILVTFPIGTGGCSDTLKAASSSGQRHSTLSASIPRASAPTPNNIAWSKSVDLCTYISISFGSPKLDCLSQMCCSEYSV